jgi:DNA-binding XRE family transcriptional regulator
MPQLALPTEFPYPHEDGERNHRVAITSEQIRAARGLLRWEQRDLAEASGLALITIKSIERRRGPLMVRTSSLYALQTAFDKAGVEFLDANNGGAGVRWKPGWPSGGCDG